jgi:hypothetical protein
MLGNIFNINSLNWTGNCSKQDQKYAPIFCQEIQKKEYFRDLIADKGKKFKLALIGSGVDWN